MAKKNAVNKKIAVKNTVKKSPAKAGPRTKKAYTKADAPREHLHYHKDGSLWAQGQMQGNVMVGFWVWFRKNGSRLRSGSFEKGVQVGEWTTYDKDGNVYKVTVMKAKK
jgi:antitoxin component YwqK of YwqJK toxin-antitoxin module